MQSAAIRSHGGRGDGIRLQTGRRRRPRKTTSDVAGVGRLQHVVHVPDEHVRLTLRRLWGDHAEVGRKAAGPREDANAARQVTAKVTNDAADEAAHKAANEAANQAANGATTEAANRAANKAVNETATAEASEATIEAANEAANHGGAKGVHILAGVGNGKVLLWEEVQGNWNSSEAARIYEGPMLEALKVAYPGQTRFRVLEDNDPSGFKARKGVDAKKRAGILAFRDPQAQSSIERLRLLALARGQ